MGEWQDIATAPKDGTAVLVYRPRAGVQRASYDPDKYISNPAPYWRGWDGTKTENKADAPTHWMPLPTPPSKDTPMAEDIGHSAAQQAASTQSGGDYDFSKDPAVVGPHFKHWAGDCDGGVCDD